MRVVQLVIQSVGEFALKRELVNVGTADFVFVRHSHTKNQIESHSLTSFRTELDPCLNHRSYAWQIPAASEQLERQGETSLVKGEMSQVLPTIEADLHRVTMNTPNTVSPRSGCANSDHGWLRYAGCDRLLRWSDGQAWWKLGFVSSVWQAAVALER